MIRSFGDRETEVLWQTERNRRLGASLWRVALRKLVMLNDAHALQDLRTPPGNRLEALLGSRLGQHSIRINDQFRICFRWRDGNAYEVEITDYH